MILRRSSAPLAALLFTAGLALSGCVAGPNYKRPAALAPSAANSGAPALPTAFKELPPPSPPNGTWKQAQPADANLKGNWWEVYRDPQLNSLEEKVAVSNQTLKAAYEQYLQAREQVKVARANYYPTLSAGPSFSRQKYSANEPSITTGRTYSTYAIQGQVAWEPDLWGQIRRTVEQSRANAQASAADLANVDLSVRSELAEDYFEMRGLDLQKKLLDDTIQSDSDYLDLTKTRFQGGVATDVDVAQAQTELDSVTAQDIDVGVARAQFEHAIATLIGTPASSFSLAFAPLTLDLPAIPAGVPSELLERRPDISGAERRTQAANAQIGIAISAYYPNVQLGGSGGFESQNAGTWVQGPSSMWSLGGSAVELLFDAGRRHALTNQAREAYEGQTANYRQSVLNAFQEVEDNLAALRILNDESQAQTRAVDSAKHSLQLSTNRYKGGVTTYLEVLTAQTTQLSNEVTQANITTRQFAASVQLIKALGGGWNTSQLPNF